MFTEVDGIILRTQLRPGRTAACTTRIDWQNCQLPNFRNSIPNRQPASIADPIFDRALPENNVEIFEPN